jgi:hypothetical protein
VKYAKKYGHVIDSGDASPLLVLSPRNRHHALAALANLAKFQGRYLEFQQIKQRYPLKWTSSNNSMQTFQRLFSNDLNFDTLLRKIKEMIRVLPVAMATVIKFNCLTGLRQAEAMESIRLLHVQKFEIEQMHNIQQYYDLERQCLEHFCFP